MERGKEKLAEGDGRVRTHGHFYRVLEDERKENEKNELAHSSQM